MTDKRMIKMLTEYVNSLPKPDAMGQQALAFTSMRDTLNDYKENKDG